MYHAKPLTAETVTQEMQPPDLAAVIVAVDSLHHPLLQPFQIDLSDGLSPDEAALISVYTNPELRVDRDRRGIAEAQLVQARVLPNPTIDASVDIPVAGETAGTMTGYTIGPSWDLSALISHPDRVKAARLSLASVDLDVAWQEWQIAQNARLAVWKLIILKHQVELARQTDANLADNVEIVRQAMNDGLVISLDFSAARSISDQAHTDYLDLEKQYTDQSLELGRMLGLPADQELPIQLNLDPPSHFSPLLQDSITAGLQRQRLDLAALQLGYQSEDMNLRAAIIAQFPAINLGVNRAKDTGNLISNGLGISIDLPLFDRNQGEIAVERATRQQLFDEYTSRVLETEYDVAALLNVIHLLNDQITVAEQAESELKQLVDGHQIMFNQGHVDALSYSSALSEWNSKQIEILSLEGSLMEARIGLEIASGMYMPDSPSTVSSASRQLEENDK